MNWPQIAPVVRTAERPAKSTVCTGCCQLPQRLLKTLHRDDAQPVGMLPRLVGVLPRRHEEEIHTRPARSDRLLFQATDLDDRAVEGELACRRDVAPVGDVTSEHADDLEGEGKAGRRAAAASDVDVPVDRELDPRRLVDRYADN